MSHVKAAKDALDQVVTTYKCSKKALHKAVSSDKPANERSLCNRMKNLEDALAALNSAHTTWISKADLTPELLKEENYNSEWLEKEWEEVGDLQELFEEKLELFEENLEVLEKNL